MWDTVELSEEQRLIQNEINTILDDFGPEYWRKKDAENEYPQEFASLLGEKGWLGALIPEEYGGARMGTSEVMVMLEEIASSSAGLGGAQAIHGALYTSKPIVKHGSEELKEKILPQLANGEKTVQAFGLTEPNAGSESTKIETRAEKDGDTYVINGQKVWTSRLDVSDYLLVITRTKEREEVEKKTEGISMFLVDLEKAYEQGAIEMNPISKMSLNLSHSFEVWFNDLEVPKSNLVGKEHEGFYQLLDGLNEERLVVSAENIGVGTIAIKKAADYARNREVFDRPIGKNQGIQHPLAKAYAQLQGARQVVYHTADRVDELEQKALGTMANTAKYLSAEAAYNATDVAVQTHGGFGLAKEYDVERFFRDARIARIAPISQQLVLSYIAENALDLPRSY